MKDPVLVLVVILIVALVITTLSLTVVFSYFKKK